MNRIEGSSENGKPTTLTVSTSLLKENEKADKDMINKTMSITMSNAVKMTHQKRSGIEEPVNDETLNDKILHSFLDPQLHSIGIQILRGFVLFLLIALFSFITFVQYYTSPISGMFIYPISITVGFLGACVLTTIVVTSRFICKRRRTVIGRDMVRWFTWSAFLNLIYHNVKPESKIDMRMTQFKGKKIDVLDEEEKFKQKIQKKRSKSKDNNPQEENDAQIYFFDFLADTGDGFDPTYAVFSSIAKSEIEVHASLKSSGNQSTIQLPRADSVFVGGDIAYPIPRHEIIMSRFIRPISWAYPAQGQSDPKPGHEEDLDESDLGTVQANTPNSAFSKLNEDAARLYVMPGNHEWFDGLVNFKKLILDRDHIGAWRTPANSPYYIVKLPYNWWAICVDLGTDEFQDIDEGQLEYFTNIVNTQTTSDDRFILMQHEPDWIKNSAHHYSLFKNFQKFRYEVLGDRLRLSLGGDLHYYRRMEETSNGTTAVVESKEGENDGEEFGKSYVTDKAQLIVAGHGGAFSQPTCNPDVKNVKLGEPWIPENKQVEFTTVISYPTPQEAVSNIQKKLFTMFDWKHNAAYGHILGAMYMLMFAAVSPLSISDATIPNGAMIPTTWPSPSQVAQSPLYMLQAVKSVFFYPAVLWIIVEHIIIAMANIPHSPLYTFKGLSFSFVHSFIQIGFAFACRRVVDIAWVAMFYSQFPPASVQNQGLIILYCFLTSVSMYILGFFVAVHLTAIFFYLVLMYGGDGFGYNEAYSPLMEKNYKGFVRIQIDKSGNLVIYSIGIEKTPLHWRETEPYERTNKSPSIFVPSDGDDLKLFLIEKITLLRNGNSLKVDP